MNNCPRTLLKLGMMSVACNEPTSAEQRIIEKNILLLNATTPIAVELVEAAKGEMPYDTRSSGEDKVYVVKGILENLDRLHTLYREGDIYTADLSSSVAEASGGAVPSLPAIDRDNPKNQERGIILLNLNETATFDVAGVMIHEAAHGEGSIFHAQKTRTAMETQSPDLGDLIMKHNDYANFISIIYQPLIKAIVSELELYSMYYNDWKSSYLAGELTYEEVMTGIEEEYSDFANETHSERVELRGNEAYTNQEISLNDDSQPERNSETVDPETGESLGGVLGFFGISREEFLTTLLKHPELHELFKELLSEQREQFVGEINAIRESKERQQELENRPEFLRK